MAFMATITEVIKYEFRFKGRNFPTASETALKKFLELPDSERHKISKITDREVLVERIPRRSKQRG